tara:strand:+ start:771 stop:1421 length:651 start_codon:yes stop_codon:yes gene_type:complete
MFIFTEENIGTIKNTVYTKDGTPDKHAESIEYSKTKGLFKDFDYSKYFDKKPPKNTSITTLQELKYLRDLPEDIEFVKKHDSVRDVFEEVCNEHGIEYPKELVNELKVSAKGIIMDLKYHFNRPRPYQLAEYYNIKLGEHILESMKTPSYPSGHSCQGILIGKVLQTKLPIKTNAFLEAGKRISYSRNIGGAHYQSDSEMGENIGSRMYEYIIHKI